MPSRVRSLLVLAAVLTLVATAALRYGAGSSDAAVSSTLHGVVGPAFDITLTFDDGSPVGLLPAGSYRVVVSDITTDHNFHLFGPGVEQSTGVDFTGSVTWNVTFRSNARYQYVCDVHADSMAGSFNAGAGDDSGPPPAASGGSGGGSGSASGGATGVSTTVSAGGKAARGTLA